jgi:hypothetical protein
MMVLVLRADSDAGEGGGGVHDAVKGGVGRIMNSGDKKADLGIRSASSSGALSVRDRLGSRTSGVAPDPPWPLPARLAEPAVEGRLVPDAWAKLKNRGLPSRVILS